MSAPHLGSSSLRGAYTRCMNLLYERTALVLAVLFIVAVSTMVWHLFLLQSNLAGSRTP